MEATQERRTPQPRSRGGNGGAASVGRGGSEPRRERPGPISGPASQTSSPRPRARTGRASASNSKPSSPAMPKSPVPHAQRAAAPTSFAAASEWTVRDGSAVDNASGARGASQPSTPNVSLPASPNLPGDAEHKPILAERFKTKMCRNFVETGVCPYEVRCMFAHGDHEIRTKTMNLADGLVTEEAIKNFQRAAAERQRKAAKKVQKRRSAAASAVASAAATPAGPNGATSGANANSDSGLMGPPSLPVGSPTTRNGAPSPPLPRSTNRLQQQQQFQREKNSASPANSSPGASALSPPQQPSSIRDAFATRGFAQPLRSTAVGPEKEKRESSDSGNDAILDAAWATDTSGSNNGAVAEAIVRASSTPAFDVPGTFAPAGTGGTLVYGSSTTASGLSAGSGGGGAVMNSTALEALSSLKADPWATPRTQRAKDGDETVSPASAPRPTPASSINSSHVFTPGIALLNLGPVSNTSTAAGGSSANTTARSAEDDDGEELLGLISALRGVPVDGAPSLPTASP